MTLAVSMHGGVVFRVNGELWFLPSSVAMKLLPTPPLGRVPGGPRELRGVALVDGSLIPVFDVLGREPEPSSNPASRGASVGARSSNRRPEAMLVCNVLGEPLGIVGIDVVATGRFDAAGAGDVKHGTETARAFDVAAIVARAREARWAV